MKLQVRTKEITLVPTICSELGGEFSITFRQPTQHDVVKMGLIVSPVDIIGFMGGLFLRFDNAPSLEDEDGKILKYKTLDEFLGYNSPIITAVVTDILNEFKKIRNDVFDIEKK